MLCLFTYTGVQHDFHIRLFLCCLTATRRISHVEEELLTIHKHPRSPPIFSGVLVARSLVFVYCFVDRCLSVCPFYFRQVYYVASIYGF
jgi:hypothetical protein